MCGGTRLQSPHGGDANGLSPRVRGNRLVRGPRLQLSGSIPACAGEPAPISRIWECKWVYPRVCGGTPPARKRRVRRWGLSPRVRGNRALGIAAPAGVRSIPACAGEPTTRGYWSLRRRVYPRVCGGTGFRAPALCLRQGLSPRVRGNRLQSCHSRSGMGSIPACAGEPFRHLAPGRISGVYPRVCGGTPDGQPDTIFRRGLSPRVRGNHDTGLSPPRPAGSIPACAGEPALLW